MFLLPHLHVCKNKTSLNRVPAGNVITTLRISLLSNLMHIIFLLTELIVDNNRIDFQSKLNRWKDNALNILHYKHIFLIILKKKIINNKIFQSFFMA